MSLGRDLDFVGHQRISVQQYDPAILPAINNIVYKATNDKTVWIEETTSKIGDWRVIFRSTYIRWAVSLNGLHVASEKYSTSKEDKQFIINSIRVDNNVPKQTTIVEWDFKTAADVHLKSAPMLCAYGLIDLYACFEEFIFDFYKIYLTHNPEHLLTGDENKPLKKLYKAYLADASLADEWNEKFTIRMYAWQRKKLYDGLGKVFLSYCNQSGIQKPSMYKLSNPTTWSETLTGISLVRHSLTHGAKTVAKELGDFCKTPNNNGFTFKENDPLEIKLFHLQATELFSDQLLTALNLSLVELGGKLSAQP
jgi:hypothetical protein